MNPESTPEPTRRAGNFPVTRWSVVHRLQAGSDSEKKSALDAIYRSYWKPVYVWLRASGSSPSDAEDVTQDFFLRMLTGGLLANASEEKGRLRAFLLVLLKRHAASAFEHRNAKKRGGGAIIDPIDAENAWKTLLSKDASPDVMFDRQWAAHLLDRVMTRLREDARSGREALFDELRGYLVGGSEEDTYADVGRRLGMSKDNVKMAAHRHRERYRQLLAAEVLETVETPDDVNSEIQYLFRVF